MSHTDKGDSEIDMWAGIVVALSVGMFVALFVYLWV